MRYGFCGNKLIILHKPTKGYKAYEAYIFPRKRMAMSHLHQAKLQIYQRKLWKKLILLMIDILCNYDWVIPLSNMMERMIAICVCSKWALKLQTNTGKAFLKNSPKSLLEHYGIHYFVTHNKTKATVPRGFRIEV